MKKILATAAMATMVASGAMAFDTDATDLEAEATAAKNAIAAVNVAVSFDAVLDGSATTFTPTGLGTLAATVDNSIEGVDVVQYVFAKDTSVSFSLTSSSTPIAADAASITTAINGVNGTIHDEFYGTTANAAALSTTSTAGVVGSMISTMVTDVTALNDFAKANLIPTEFSPSNWANFDTAATAVGSNLAKLNATIGSVETALGATTPS